MQDFINESPSQGAKIYSCKFLYRFQLCELATGQEPHSRRIIVFNKWIDNVICQTCLVNHCSDEGSLWATFRDLGGVRKLSLGILM